MSTTTNGRIKVVKKNDYGFYSFKIGDTWYGSGKKEFGFEEGDVVEFDFYLKDDKWATVKGDVRKIANTAPAEKPAAKGGYSNTRDDYWTKKGERDVNVVEPRITYLAAYERALGLATLAFAHGALSLEKAKQADKLGIITAFVDGQTMRIAQTAMSVTAAPAPVKAEPLPPLQDEDPENWK